MRREMPVGTNLALAAGLLLVGLTLFVILPLGLLPLGAAWGWLTIPLALSTPTLWALIHEAVHGGLHPDRRLNDALGRALSIGFGAPYRLLRVGHLMHHRLSRSGWDRTEVVDGPRPGLRARVCYYARLLGGLYLVEVGAGVAVWLPRRLLRRWAAQALPARGDGPNVLATAEHQLLARGPLSELRVDSAAVLTLIATGLWLYGAHWPLLVAALLGRGLLVSFLDNAYHYGTPLEAPGYAHDLELPAWVSRGLLHFNLHGVHHRHPTLPWAALPARFAAEGGAYAGGLLPVALRQLRGPIPARALPRAVAAVAPP